MVLVPFNLLVRWTELESVDENAENNFYSTRSVSCFKKCSAELLTHFKDRESHAHARTWSTEECHPRHRLALSAYRNSIHCSQMREHARNRCVHNRVRQRRHPTLRLEFVRVGSPRCAVQIRSKYTDMYHCSLANKHFGDL